MISIIDYGAGNLKSISNALKKVGAETEVVSSVNDADALVLPGVGNFGDAMQKLALVKQDIIDSIAEGKPFLGLCLGLQVLFEGSDEAPGVDGFGVIKGKCLRFNEGKVPHMGWNQINDLRGGLFEGLKDGENFYFVHSYYGPLVDETIAFCNYGVDFSAAVQKDNVYACQFHPERSGEAGLKVLKNFVRQVKR